MYNAVPALPNPTLRLHNLAQTVLKSPSRSYFRTVQPCAPDTYIGPKVYKQYLRGACLESHGDFLSRLITPISRITTPSIPIINLLTESP